MSYLFYCKVCGTQLQGTVKVTPDGKRVETEPCPVCIANEVEVARDQWVSRQYEVNDDCN